MEHGETALSTRTPRALGPAEAGTVGARVGHSGNLGETCGTGDVRDTGVIRGAGGAGAVGETGPCGGCGVSASGAAWASERADGERLARSYDVRGCTVVELSGDVDLATAGEIRVVLDEATAPNGTPHVVVDLRRTTFFDCTGLALLVRAEERMTQRAGRLGLVCAHAVTLRLMEIANLTGLLRPVPTLEQALERAA